MDVNLEYAAYFEEFLFDWEHKIYLAIGSYGSGKSHETAIKIMVKLMQEKRRCAVVREVYETHLESTYRLLEEVAEVLDLDGELVTFKKSPLTVEFANGSKIIFKGLDKVEKMKGLQGVSIVWIEEASEIKYAGYKELLLRLRTRNESLHIILATNPVSEENWLMKDYIKNANSESGIIEYRFTLYSNVFLDERYRERIKASTPNGMLYDRNIHGLWVSGQGAIYADFDKNKHVISRADFEKNIKPRVKFYSASVDWGFALNHYGVIGVFAYDHSGNVYLIEEHAETLKEIDHWVKVAKGVKSRYRNILFTADSARPEHVARFNREGIKTVNANKEVVAGIETLSTLMKQERFFVLYDECPRFREEIFVYAWNPITGMPIKEMDDCMDMCRYNIHTLRKMNKLKFVV